MFWTIAGAILFIAAVITLFPLLRGKSTWQPIALALAFGLPALGLWMYDHTGTPGAIGIKPVPRAAQTAAPPAIRFPWSYAKSVKMKMSKPLS